MRALQYDQYGSVDVLKLRDVAVPEPADGAVQVKVAAASVAGGEAMIRAGRLRRMVRLKFPAGVGRDFAGHVTKVGSGVTSMRIGDPVWGMLPHQTFGTVAEFIVTPADLVVAAPRNIDLVEAASLPGVATTALTAIVDKTHVSQGDRVLIRGAAGGLGTILVQLAKAKGAHVTALVRERDRQFILDLGADVALDYRSTMFETLGEFDAIIDCVGTELPSLRNRLARSGTLLALALDPDHPLKSALYVARHVLTRSQRVSTFSNNPDKARLLELTQLVEEGTIRPIIADTYPIDQAAEAHRRLERGGVRGKVVVAVYP